MRVFVDKGLITGEGVVHDGETMESDHGFVVALALLLGVALLTRTLAMDLEIRVVGSSRTELVEGGIGGRRREEGRVL